MQQLRGSERPQGSLRGWKLQVRGWRQEAGSVRHVAVKGVQEASDESKRPLKGVCKAVEGV